MTPYRIELHLHNNQTNEPHHTIIINAPTIIKARQYAKHYYRNHLKNHPQNNIHAYEINIPTIPHNWKPGQPTQ